MIGCLKNIESALIKLISMHGISEIMGALPEKEWVPKAPSLNRKLGIMAKVQDEMGHGQLLLTSSRRFIKTIWKKPRRFNAGFI